MKSPFPGMDPFIEACGLWEGFHSHLIEAIYQALASILPKGYSIDTAVRSYVVLLEVEGKQEHLAKADVTVLDSGRTRKPLNKQVAVALAESTQVAESVPMQAFVAEKFQETFVEIYAELEDRLLVTCIEVLSPSNKRRGTAGWREYERKRQALLLGQANFVEIDLLRAGHKPTMMTPWPDSPYTLLVSRADRAPACRVWLANYQRPLSPIPVPLLYPDADLTLDLQPLIETIYAVGRYHERIDYTRPLSGVWSDAEANAVRSFLKNRPSSSQRKTRQRP